jgi:peptidase M28-like protein
LAPLPASPGSGRLMASRDLAGRVGARTGRTHVDHLAGEIGERNVFRPTALQAAASYIEHEWEQQGYAVRRLAYDVSGVPCLNLEITRTGGVRQREILLIGAHYDTVAACPGANDNTSGVSALLELSRLFASVEPALTVRFVAFVNEEPPFFMTRQQGSMVYDEAARRRGDDIRLMASIETIGWYSSEPGSQSYPPLFNLFYPDHADFIGFVSNFRSRSAMRRLAVAFRANSDFPLETAATFSFVHRSFWRAATASGLSSKCNNTDRHHERFTLKRSWSAAVRAIGIAVAFGRAVGSSVANLAIALARGAGKGRVRQEKGVSAKRNL